MILFNSVQIAFDRNAVKISHKDAQPHLVKLYNNKTIFITKPVTCLYHIDNRQQ